MCILLQFWAEKAEKVFPNHDVVFHLKVRSYVECIGRVQNCLSLGLSLHGSIQLTF